MRSSIPVIALVLAAGLAGCDRDGGESAGASEPATSTEEETVSQEPTSGPSFIEIAPGLTATILQRGHGRAATAGDYVEVHYTGWLFDPDAEDNRGSKFDSSVDRGERFMFQLGAGQVIKGWDQGVAGMLIGEKRELTLAPEMGYGNRGAGNIIPPGATLVFEVELFGLEQPGGAQ